MDEMKRYVLENHSTGLVWNSSVRRAHFTSIMTLNTVDDKGVHVSEFKAPQSAEASPPSPPPPPPPPPPPSICGATPAPAPAAGGVAAVFAELNRGEEVTKGLRKVDKSEMTHKNPALRAGNTVPSSGGPGGLRLLVHSRKLCSWSPCSSQEANETRETRCTDGKETIQVRTRGEQMADCEFSAGTDNSFRALTR